MAKVDMVQVSRDLVERARSGDQNAMAIIQLVGVNARKEEKDPTAIRARVAYACLKRAIAHSDIGSEPMAAPPQLITGVARPRFFAACVERLQRCKDGMHAAIVRIANGPLLTRGAGHAYSNASMGSESARIVLQSAHAIQCARNPNIPLAKIWPDVAWELGE